MGMSIQVNDFRWEPGKNDGEYIKLLEESRDEWQKMAQKAIAKLKTLSKTQEPRLLTLQEALEPKLMTWGELRTADHVYIETNEDGIKYIAPGIVTIVRDDAVIASVRIGSRLIDGTIAKEDYNKNCRCWNIKPTEEQRRAVKWDD